MNQHVLAAVALALPILFATSLASAAITVRDSQGGKVILVVDDETVRTSAEAKPSLFIDGPKISKEKGGQPLFVVPGDIAYAYKYEGEVVQYIDGRQMRDKPGGKETLYVSDPDIREPDVHGKPLYWVDNHEVLNRQQLIAAIYTLRPELFKMPTAPAADAAPAATAFAGGTYSIASFKSSDGAARAGKVTIAKVGETFAIEVKPDGGEAMAGVGVAQDGELWAAIGPVGATGLAVYTIDGGTLAGTWFNAAGDKNSFGSETLSGNATLGGPYAISAGKAPFTGAAYAGTLTVDAAKTSLGDAPVFNLNWDLGGGYKASGVAFKAGNHLVAASAGTADPSIVRFKIAADGTLTGDFATAKANGSYTLKRD